MSNSELIIDQNETLISALEKLSSVKNYINLTLFVYNEKKQIIGSVTDGDIRRSLILDKDLNKKIGQICFRKFSYIVNSNEFQDLDSFRKKNIKILPILNKNKTLHKVIDLNKTKSILPLECVIMAR